MRGLQSEPAQQMANGARQSLASHKLIYVPVSVIAQVAKAELVEVAVAVSVVIAVPVAVSIVDPNGTTCAGQRREQSRS